MSTLTTTDLRVRWPAQDRWALDGITTTIVPGTLTWLHGALGAGCSTLLLALAGLAPRLTGGEREGRACVGDRDPADASPLDLGLAYLGPSPALQLSGVAATVWDEVAVGPMNLGWPIDHIQAAVDGALDRVGGRSLGARRPDRLSGGETQRVLLAALLVTDPRVLLLDEPFSALDRAGREQAAALLRQLAAEGRTVVVACDDADTMCQHADRVVVLREGRVVHDGLPAAILASSAFRATGAATTDAGALAWQAGWAAPIPLTAAAILAEVRPDGGGIRSDPAGADEPPPSAPPPLVLEGVTFRYPNRPPVLVDVSLQVDAGTTTALLGPNGAGKSTLLRVAMALEHPEAGTVRTLGHATAGRGPEDLAPRVGFLFQQPERQLFAASVRAECAMGPMLAGWSAERTEEATAGALARLGLEAVADEHPWDLPLPLRRLVALASVLVAAPHLLLLDEPTAALDARSRDLVIAAIRTEQAAGTTVLAVTHDAIFAHEALDTAILLGEGHAVAMGSLAEQWGRTGLARTAALEVGTTLRLPPRRSRRERVAEMLAGRRGDTL